MKKRVAIAAVAAIGLALAAYQVNTSHSDGMPAPSSRPPTDLSNFRIR